MSWAIYQHVAHRVSRRYAIEEMFQELFGLRVTRQQIHGFKSLMATLLSSVAYGRLLWKR